MDSRRSFYLAGRQDEFISQLEAGIGYLTDNERTKDGLSARCGALLRRVIALHSLR